MAFWNKTTTLTAAIDDWRARDLLDINTAKALTDDIAAQKSSASFQSILVLLAIICLGFGAITFVAANWDEISRQARVALVFGAMWAAWGSAAIAASKSHQTLAQALVLLSCILFGAGIMLIAQIYHMQGEPADATWLWAMGTLLAAALTRSVPALCLAIALLGVWAFMDGDFLSGRRYTINYGFLAYLVLCALLARWLHSRVAAHLILLTLSGWIVASSIATLDDDITHFVRIIHFLTYILLALALFFEGGKNILRGFERPLIAYLVFTLGYMSLIWFVVAQDNSSEDLLFGRTLLIPAVALVATIAMALAGRMTNNQNTYDLTVTIIAVILTGAMQTLAGPIPFAFEAFMLALTIWVIRMGWRLEYRPVTVLGFLGFAGVMTLIYFTTIGTLLGTSAFYLGAGILLLLGVFLVPRLMRKSGGTT